MWNGQMNKTGIPAISLIALISLYLTGCSGDSGPQTMEPVDLPAIEINIPNMPEGAVPLAMVLIPAGTFTMGSPDNEEGRLSREGPQHQVTITHPFYMSRYEVTQAIWEIVMSNNPSQFKSMNHPVENVSWNECLEFIQRINTKGVGLFRLPTEAEWEYACRAGMTTPFYWGSEGESEINKYAWYNGNNQPNGTKEVGLKLPNAWGLFDMSGNVYEWCHDWYGEYSSRPQTDPTGPASSKYHIVRGGRWGNTATYCRSAYRAVIPPG